MPIEYYKLVESIVVLVLYFFIRSFSFKIIDKTLSERFINNVRGALVKRIITVIYTLLLAALLIVIWGVDHNEVLIFVGSILTVLGIAFFAQWSILSNITSGIIIFFNHPVKINDRIILLEGKDYVVEGTVIEIGMFFITLESQDSEKITLPNNIFIQKSIKKGRSVEQEGEKDSLNE